MKDFAQSVFRSVVPVTLLVLLTGGIALDVMIAERLEEDFDELMLAKSLGLIALAEDGDDGVEMENYQTSLPSYALNEDADYFQLLSDNGDVVIESDSLSYWPDTSHPLPGPYVQDAMEFLNITLPDGRPGRLMRKRFVPRLDYDEGGQLGHALELDARFLEYPGNRGAIFTEHLPEGSDQVLSIERRPLVLQLAMSRDKLESLINTVHSVLLLTGLGIMVAFVLLARRGIRQAVKPLRSITDELHTIDAQRFDQRLSSQTDVSELQQLTQSVNVLLERVDSAFERERRFSGDVAHELRTPLAELRTLLEVSERWPDDPVIKESFNTDVLSVAERMQRIVETLLQLSRSEQGTDMLLACPNLGALVHDCVQRLQSKADERQIQVSVSVSDWNLPVIGLDQWQCIIGNLLDNALEYAEPATQVSIELLATSDTGFRFSISNHAPDLQQADLEHMYERLWQKDHSRTSGMHSGLGLSLVKSCCKQLGTTLNSTLENERLIISIDGTINA